MQSIFMEKDTLTRAHTHTGHRDPQLIFVILQIRYYQPFPLRPLSATRTVLATAYVQGDMENV